MTAWQISSDIWHPNIPHDGAYSDELQIWNYSFLPESYSHLATLFQGSILNAHKLAFHMDMYI